LLYDGKYWFAGLIAPGVNGYAVLGTVVTIPGFSGSPGIIKYPADFEFPLSRDKGGIFENP
jgi:hypothetical protein